MLQNPDKYQDLYVIGIQFDQERWTPISNAAEFALSELSNYEYDTYSWFKNRWLLLLYADVAECDIREYNNHTIDPTQYSPPGKDGKHPGQGWHDAMAQMILDKTPRVPL